MACQHPRTASELRFVRPRKVDRVTKCHVCRRIIARRKSRWASRRWMQYDERSNQHARHRGRAIEEARRLRSMPYAARLHEELGKLRSEVRWRFKGQSDVHPYHPLAIRYRRLLRQWWKLPSKDVAQYLDHEPPAAVKGASIPAFQAAVRKLEELRESQRPYAKAHRERYPLPDPDEAYKLARRAAHVFLRHEPTLWEPAR